MKILYFMDAMHFGGAAKKSTTIANELYRRGHEVSFVTDTHYPVGYPLEGGIHIIPLYMDDCTHLNRLTKVLRKLKRVRSIVNKYRPEVVITVLPHVSFYVKIALLGKKTPIVFSDETSFARKDTRFVHFIRHSFYNTADAVVVLTENDVKLLGKNIPKKVAIHNPVVCPDYGGNIEEKEKTILAIGPLKEWDIKGFDLLFKAFMLFQSKFPGWKISIAGDDREPYKSEVNEIIKANGLEGRVELLGYRSDIFDLMEKSSVYAMSSRVEGFSLALVEALSQGCACVAFANHGVIEEVTCGGKGVLIVDDGDVEAFSNALKQLMTDEELRKKMANDGMLCVKEYSLGAIVDKWEALFARL
ncbi:MAG: glycosyltransferase [Bacteroidaceae bacterium]|nr:glycosyltransferase [Bacteroidaceae bacterium]